MAHEHWFDLLSKATSRTTTRRQVARSLAVLLPGLFFRLETEAAARKKPSKRRGGGKKSSGKGKGQKDRKPQEPVPPAAPDSCQCGVGETCCGGTCCPANQHCCGETCCSANLVCCGPRCAPANDPVMKCCDGMLMNTLINPDHCGECGHACEAGQYCRDGGCINSCTDLEFPYETWTQECGGQCIPATALCCETYWCWDAQEVACCPDTLTCRRADEAC